MVRESRKSEYERWKSRALCIMELCRNIVGLYIYISAKYNPEKPFSIRYRRFRVICGCVCVCVCTLITSASNNLRAAWIFRDHSTVVQRYLPTFSGGNGEGNATN